MKNKLIDLNNHLFEQLERLNDQSLTPEDIEKEVTRTDAMVNVSEQIIATAAIVLRGAELIAEYGGKYANVLPGHEESTKAIKEIEGSKK